jgi:hypothetical protein
MNCGTGVSAPCYAAGEGADLFETDDNRRAYLRISTKYGDQHGMDIWAYCLMINQIHLP